MGKYTHQAGGCAGGVTTVHFYDLSRQSLHVAAALKREKERRKNEGGGCAVEKKRTLWSVGSPKWSPDNIVAFSLLRGSQACVETGATACLSLLQPWWGGARGRVRSSAVTADRKKKIGRGWEEREREENMGSVVDVVWCRLLHTFLDDELQEVIAGSPSAFLVHSIVWWQITERC